MILKLVCVVFLLTCVVAQCPKCCVCPEKADNLIIEMHCINNSLSEIPSGDFQEMLFLDLSFNNFTTLKNNTFVETNITKLVRLYFNNNRLKTIEEYAFRGLKQVRLLNLAQNDITTLHSNLFEDNDVLEVLDMDGNPNLKLPESLYSPNLDIIVLKYCGLQNIPTHFFKDMLNLQYIFLKGNHLSTFNPQIILPLSNLKRIDLSDNKFTSLPFDLSQTLPSELTVYFGGNPLHCDCDLESVNTLNEQKRLYYGITCGTSTLQKFLEDRCTNKPPSSTVGTSVLPTSVSVTPPVTRPTTTTEDDQSQAILPQDQTDADSLMSFTMWWVLGGAVIGSVIMIAIVFALLRKHKHVREYTMPRTFIPLNNEEEEQNFIT